MIANLLAILSLIEDALMHKHLITALCLIVALVLYAVGWTGGAIGLMILGAIFELAFWIRLARVDGPPSVRSEQQ